MSCQCVSVRLIPRGVHMYCSNMLLIIATVLAKLTMLAACIMSSDTFFVFNSAQKITLPELDSWRDDYESDKEDTEEESDGEKMSPGQVVLVVLWWIGVFLLPPIIISLTQNRHNLGIFKTHPGFLFIGVISHFQIGPAESSNGEGPRRYFFNILK